MTFKTEPLEQVCDLVIDCPHSTPMWLDEGIVVIRNTNIRNGRLDFSKPSFTNEENYLYRSKRAEIQENDIIITREAPMGEVCIIPKGLKACLGQRQVLLRAGNDINPKYLFYALQSPYVQHQVSWNEGTGTTVSNIRIPFLKQFLIPRNKNSEDQIAHILSTLDDKIELNRKMNQTLEEMAQALFKSWFVDFDPVHAKAYAKSDEALESAAAELGVSKEVLELFPGEFEESEMGMIPKGWSNDVLGFVCKVQSGYAFKGAWWQDTGVKVVKIKNINGTEVDTNNCQCVSHEIADKNAKFKLNHGDCLIAMTGATVGKVGIIDTSEEEFLLNQRVGRFQPIEHYVEYIKTLTKTGKFFDAIQSEAQGSAQPNISATGIEEIKIVKPSDMVMEAFEKVLQPIFSKMLSHQSEVHTLQRTRDTLLPKLLSGELDVSNIKVDK